MFSDQLEQFCVWRIAAEKVAVALEANAATLQRIHNAVVVEIVAEIEGKALEALQLEQAAFCDD
jgi:hypothetical protein